MIREGKWGLYKADRDIGILTEEHLEFSLACLLANRKNRRANKDVEYYDLKVSQDLLRYFAGNNRFLQDMLSRDGSFFGIGNDCEAGFRYRARARSLATILYNFQTVPGIKHRIATLAQDDLESILGEMECARLICHPNNALRFIIPPEDSPTKGECYDAEFTTNAGRVVSCEFKAKSKETDMTAKSVWNTCNSARQQLPKGKPGIIFLRLPEQWTSQTRFKDIIQPGLEKAVRQSDRIVAVVIVWEVWWANGGQRMASYHFDSWLNKQSCFFDVDILESVKTFATAPENWVRIEEFVARMIQGLKERIPID